MEHYREIGALGDLELIQQKVAALFTKGNIFERDNRKAIDALRLFLVVSFEKQSGVVTERAVAHAWRVIVGTSSTQSFAWLKPADNSFDESGSDKLTVGLDNVAMESLQRLGLHLGWEFARVMLDEAECNALDIVNVFAASYTQAAFKTYSLNVASASPVLSFAKGAWWEATEFPDNIARKPPRKRDAGVSALDALLALDMPKSKEGGKREVRTKSRHVCGLFGEEELDADNDGVPEAEGGAADGEAHGQLLKY